MMAKRHDLARPLLQRVLDQVPSNKVGWAKSAWALARMEEAQGNHSLAADLYRRYSESQTMPIHFRLQARLLWISCLTRSGATTDLLAMRSQIEEALNPIQDPDILLNFARQLPGGDSPLNAWREQLSHRGETIALQRFHDAQHPSIAISILFKLARRQVYDFSNPAAALNTWYQLDQNKKDWLWSTKSCFWEYLGILVDAHSYAGRDDQIDAFAQAWLDDPATPEDGRVNVGIPYSEWLIQNRRMTEALNLFEQIIQEAPTHPLCATAWYWKALQAHKLGDVSERDRCCHFLRKAQGAHVGLARQKCLDAKGLLLVADLRVDQVDPLAANCTPEFLGNIRGDILHELEFLP